MKRRERSYVQETHEQLAQPRVLAVDHPARQNRVDLACEGRSRQVGERPRRVLRVVVTHSAENHSTARVEGKAKRSGFNALLLGDQQKGLNGGRAETDVRLQNLVERGEKGVSSVKERRESHLE